MLILSQLVVQHELNFVSFYIWSGLILPYDVMMCHNELLLLFVVEEWVQ